MQELLAGTNLADEPSYYSDDHQTRKKPGQGTFTGIVDNGTSAARHGFPLGRLYAQNPRCFPLSPPRTDAL